ncbi:MAG: response regulator [Candidatus Eisenbacteria bacterium]|nr:response regulator [Candidatus Eisenbacteria bacterium]
MAANRIRTARRQTATHFAPAERATPEALEAQVRKVQEHPVVTAILDSISGVLFILNDNRQIVAANGKMLTRAGLPGAQELVGKRPGEALGCIHRHDGPGGCGTGDSCRRCGGVLAILGSREVGDQVRGECLLTTESDDGRQPHEFDAVASRIEIGDEQFTVLCMQDISDRKQRETLQRVFFHDILNTLNGLQGTCELLQTDDTDILKEAGKRIHHLCQHIIDKVKMQQALIAAEEGRLVIDKRPVPPGEILEKLRDSLTAHGAAKGRQLKVAKAGDEESIVTDETLVLRVLTNMVLNAMEATPAGGAVEVTFEAREDGWRFAVKNPGVIPQDVQSRIFQRSFSTKSEAGRGLGTYSMKLFGERYLGGRVSFASGEEKGTVFHLELPRSGEPAAGNAQLSDKARQLSGKGGGGPRAGAGREKIRTVSADTEPAEALPVVGETGGKIDTSAEAVESRTKAAEPLNGKVVLLVEDVMPVRKVSARILVMAGATVLEAQGGKEALRILELLKTRDPIPGNACDEVGCGPAVVKLRKDKRKLDLMVLDLMMPDLSGQEVLYAIRKDRDYNKLPVLIQSADSEKDNVLRCIRLGIQGYIVKPVEPGALITAVGEALNRGAGEKIASAGFGREAAGGLSAPGALRQTA